MTRRQALHAAAAAGVASVGMGAAPRQARAQQGDEAPTKPAPIALGAFIPGAPGDPTRIDQIAGQIGRMPAFVQWYEAWGSARAVTGEVIDLELLNRVTERGAAPMITWEPWDPAAGAEQAAYRLSLIASGDFDDYVNSWAYRLAAYGGTVYLRFGHEMNAPWYPWGAANGNAPDDFTAAWRHLRELFWAAGAANVRWVWTPDAGTHGATPLHEWYPGDEWIDWIGLDGYNWGDAHPETGWRSFEEIFRVAYMEITALAGKPVMIAETACAEVGGDKAAWIRNAFTNLAIDFPAVRAVCWFNEPVNGMTWPVDSSPEALAAFAEAARKPELSGTLP